ncbi:MAG: hypothetical protein Fur0015_03140 [Ignavibacteriales bacterium]
MKKSNAKILSLIILSSLLAVIVILSITLNEEDQKTFSKINLSGNILCSSNDYLKFLHLNNPDDYSALTPKIVRDRFQKHPYIETVTVNQEDNELNIKIKEKIIDAALLYIDSQYLITNKSQVIPFLSGTYELKCPLISNPKIEKKLKVLASCKKQNDIVAALKIITTIQNSNPQIIPSISEIDLREGKDILLTLEGKDFPIIIGRSNLVSKSFLLSNSWDYLTNSSLNDVINHIDLRYKDMMVFGFKDSLIERGNKI